MPLKRILLLLLPALPARADALEHLKDALEKLEALELEAAEEAIDKAIAEKPDFAAAYVARARLRSDRGDAQGAAEDALKASELGMDLWGWASTLGQAAQDYRLTAKAAEGAYERHGSVCDLKAIAESWAAAGEFQEAIGWYDKLIPKAQGADRLVARMDRGFLLSLNGDHKAALAALDGLLGDAPRYVRAYQLRGRVKLRKGDIKGALQDYETAKTINSGHPSAYLILGLAYYDVGDYKKAIEAFERATAFSNAHEYTHLYLCLARSRTGVPAERLKAMRELMKFLESRKEQNDWFAALGGYLIGNVSEEQLLKAARQGGKDQQRERLCEAWGYIGQRAMIAGERDRAVERFEKCLATKVGSFMEYGSAHMELRRIGKR